VQQLYVNLSRELRITWALFGDRPSGPCQAVNRVAASCRLSCRPRKL